VFARLADVMGQPTLSADPRYATHGARGAHAEELDDLIARWTATVDADDLLARLERGGVPAGRIYQAKDMLADPHFAARQSVVRLAHPDFGELPMQNVFPRLSETPGRVRAVGPTLGQHTDEVYRDLLGLDDAELDRLRAAGVV
jgi:formyl-CoA transferase